MENSIRRHNIYLTLIYFFSHVFLLLASGKWWDDWCGMGLSLEEFSSWINQMGRPDLIYQYYIYNYFPPYMYRIFTFLFFYTSMFCIGYILKRVFRLDEESRFFICALYATFPVNDCRMIFSVFPYTVGFFVYVAAFVQLVYMFSNKKMHIIGRCFNLCLFCLSFTLNSNLVYYLLVIFLIIYYERNKEKINTIIIKYMDYLLLPILFFAAKSVFYTPYGSYAGYNAVSLFSLIKTLVYIIPADFFVMINVLQNYFSIPPKMVLMILISLTILCIYNHKKYLYINCKNGKILSINYEKNNESVTRSSVMLLAIGFVMLSLGLFAYVAVRQTFAINTVGLAGRDAILVAPSGAILTWWIVRNSMSKHVIPYVFALFVMCGTIHFNQYYIEYQWDYYKQIGFQYQLANHMELKKLRDIVYVNNDNRKINISSFYSLNANAELIYKNQERFIRDVDCQKSLKNMDGDINKFISNPIYHMSSYVSSSGNVDGILFYGFDATLKDVLLLKFYEYVNPRKFTEEIKKHSKMKVVDNPYLIEDFMNDYNISVFAKR